MLSILAKEITRVDGGFHMKTIPLQQREYINHQVSFQLKYFTFLTNIIQVNLYKYLNHYSPKIEQNTLHVQQRNQVRKPQY